MRPSFLSQQTITAPLWTDRLVSLRSKRTHALDSAWGILCGVLIGSLVAGQNSVLDQRQQIVAEYEASTSKGEGVLAGGDAREY